jgi:mercuric ion transport protein
VDPRSSRPRVELLYFPGCPNVAPARVQLQQTLIQAGLPARWEEHDVSADDAPAHTRGYGSPTILVDGRDVSGGSPVEGSACRLYPGSEVPGVPPQAAILHALGVTPGSDGLAAYSNCPTPGTL